MARHYKKEELLLDSGSDRIECTVTESESVVVEHIFECVTVELNMRKMKQFVVSCMYATTCANVGAFINSYNIS